MDTLLWQDWTTVQGVNTSVIAPSGTLIVAQSADSWLDVGDYEDITIFAQIVDVVGSVTVQIQTAPSRLEASFVNVFASPNAVSAQSASLAAVLLARYANIPVSRYLRWQWSFVGTSVGPWSVTFRLTVAGYSYS